MMKYAEQITRVMNEVFGSQMMIKSCNYFCFARSDL